MISTRALSLATAGWATAATVTALAYRHRLHTDDLTGIGNRHALHHRAHRTRSNRGLVGLLMTDLDGFKAINDTHGHDFGNHVLSAVAARLADAARPGELAVRLHGDEFALWLGHLHNPDHAEHRAVQVSAALSIPLWIDGHRITAAGSVGLATGPARTPVSELLGAADRHMYKAKATRRLHRLPTSARRTRDITTPPDHAA